MDPITIEKLRAMKQYKKTNFLQSLIQYSLTAFVLGLFVSNGFPTLCSSMKFFSVSLPNMGAFIVGPKCLFIVCNMIVIYLIGEFKLVGSTPSDSPVSDLYDDYLKQSQGLRRLSTIKRKEGEKKKWESYSIEETVDVIKQVVMDGKEEKEGGEEDKKKKGEEVLGGEEELGLPADELNKRVEDFIAKVNKQRWIEAKMMVCSG